MARRQAPPTGAAIGDAPARPRRRSSTVRTGVIAAGASVAFLTAVAVGSSAQADIYCSPGANGSVCATQSSPSARGKTVIARVDVTFGGGGSAAYETPNWQAGWNACRQADVRTRSISWTYKEYRRDGNGKVTWACYLQQ